MTVTLRPPRADLPVRPDALIEEARERQRHGRLRVAIAGIVVVGLGAGLYLGLRGGRAPWPSMPAPGPRIAVAARGHTFHVYLVSGVGLLVYPGGYLKSEIALRYPSGWLVTNGPLDAITNPVQMFVLSSYLVPAGRQNVDGPATPPTPFADGCDRSTPGRPAVAEQR